MTSDAIVNLETNTGALLRPNRSALYRSVLQSGLFVWAVALAYWGTVSFVVGPLVVLGICCIGRTLGFANSAMQARMTELICWASTAVVIFRLFSPSRAYSIDPYYITLCVLVAGATLLTWFKNPKL